MLRLLRRGLWIALGLLAVFGLGAVARWPVCWPFDVVWNARPAVLAPELRAPADGRTRVVFLVHGLWRTSASLGRLERSLRAHGYQVENFGYPSTEDFLAAHARRLRDAVEARWARGPIDELAFVGHSMGGLVIEEYLRRGDARPPTACVYLATPHRGAILADKRRHWWLFQLVMGDRAAAQLATTDAFHRQPIPFGGRSGTVLGDIGAGNPSIPGNDDGTVGVSEATFAGARDRATVPYGHTSIAVAAPVIRQVLHFLRHGAFQHD
ncbi:MAG TPA: alpha/beta fold hydrolase [bacterium]|nr:alpha/beta fold hydrolase [bacterium]